MEGAYRDDTFTIHEVQSAEKLRNLMTWNGFNPYGDTIDFDYPDFVHEDLRRDDLLLIADAYTVDNLPCGHGNNPTYGKYMDILGIAEGEDCYELPSAERAIFDIV